MDVPELHVWGFTWMSLSCVGVHMDVPELHVWGFTWMSLSCMCGAHMYVAELCGGSHGCP